MNGAKHSFCSGPVVSRISQALSRGLRYLFSSESYVVYQHDLGVSPLPLLNPRIQVRFSTNWPDVEMVLRANPNVYEMDELAFDSLQRCVQEGEECFSVWAGKQLAFFGWVQFKYRRPVPRTQIPLGPGSAYIYRCYTMAKFRGLNIYPAALAFACRRLENQGFRKVFIDHAWSNEASRRGIETFGANAIGNYRLLRFLGLRWARFDSKVLTAMRAEPAVEHALSGSH